MIGGTPAADLNSLSRQYGPRLARCQEAPAPNATSILQHFSAEPFGLGGNSHPLIIGQQNPFVLLFLLLHEDPNLLSKVVNRFVELLSM